MSKTISEAYVDGKEAATDMIKKYIYDIICAVIIVAVIAASLDAIKLADYSGEDGKIELWNFFISWVPYFMAAMLLNNTLYKKGAFNGKNSLKFIAIVDVYSDIVNNLTGKQIKDLQEFCDKYNDEAVASIQTQILKKEGISFELFENGVLDEEGSVKIPALKTLDKNSLKELAYNKEQIKAVLKAKKVTVKGLTVNMLLSSIDIKDPTNIGKTEKQLNKEQDVRSILVYLLWTIVMTFLGIKDITTWGWAGLIVVIFKVTWVFVKSYMSYFRGFNDMVINLFNHISRKTDILKVYINYVPEKKEVNEELETIIVE